MMLGAWAVTKPLAVVPGIDGLVWSLRSPMHTAAWLGPFETLLSPPRGPPPRLRDAKDLLCQTPRERGQFQRSKGPHPKYEQPKQHSALKFSQSLFDPA